MHITIENVILIGSHSTPAALFRLNSTEIDMKRKAIRILAVIITCTLCTAVIFLSSSVSSTPPPDSSVSGLSGKSIYDARCSTCHGVDGKGAGIAAAFLNPRPRNFTSGKFKFRTTESGSIPTDADLERTIRNGLHGTSMPDWKDFLSSDSLRLVIAYIKSFSPRFVQEQPKIVAVGSPIPSSLSSVAAGKKVFDRLECASCHGSDGAGKDAIATDLVDDWGNEIAASNLTEPWTFRDGSAPQNIYLRIRTGIDGSPMPSYKGSANDQEMWNLSNYIVSLARKPVWKMNASEVAQYYTRLSQESKSNPVAHGKYLTRVLGCATCHSSYNTDGTLMEGLRFAGGLKWSLGPYGTVVDGNLTSDKETGLGNWTDDEIKRCITRGIRKDGSRSLPFPMPWTNFAHLSEDDLNAIVAYLRTLPPVYNKIPPPEPLNVFSYLWGKFKMLILKEDFASLSYPGNAGTTGKEGSR